MKEARHKEATDPQGQAALESRRAEFHPGLVRSRAEVQSHHAEGSKLACWCVRHVPRPKYSWAIHPSMTQSIFSIAWPVAGFVPGIKNIVVP